jgi:hypothetical protein
MSCTKKRFSANEIQEQLGWKRYEPVWTMVHKLCKAIRNGDARYTLEGMIEQKHVRYFKAGVLDSHQSEGIKDLAAGCMEDDAIVFYGQEHLLR